MADIAPAELAALLDYAERARAQNWSLRAALTRYAQPEPQRASDLIESMRRAEFGLRPHLKHIERNGAAYWAALSDGRRHDHREDHADENGGIDGDAVALLRVLSEIDAAADEIVAWAITGQGERPDVLVDEVTARVAQRLDELGVPHEERPRPAGRRG